MNPESAGRQIAERLGAGGSLLVLTGAGLSAESGVPTFRDNGGLWESHRVEDVATPEAWNRDRDFVTRFYNMRRAALRSVEPNPGHGALAELEAALGSRLWLITQNVDDLLERGGAKRVFHMHGELKKLRCEGCGMTWSWEHDVDLAKDACGGCSRFGPRPNIVWFGEIPFFLEDAIPRALSESTVFMSVGTSGMVYPAAGFVLSAKRLGALTVEVNLEPSLNADDFDLQLVGRSGELLPALVESIESALRV